MNDPVISSFSPTSGVAGDSIVLSGANLTQISTIEFNGTATTFTINSDTAITALVPRRATSGPIKATAPGKVFSTEVDFTIIGSPPNTVIQASTPSINSALGTAYDDTAYYLSGGYNTRAPWSLISLVRGLINRFDQLLNGYGTFRTISDVYQGTVQDFSGVISNANVSIQASGNLSRKWLLIQNHGFLNNATGQYEGDLWINIGFSALDPAFPDSANIGAGSIKLSPGATFRSESSISPYGCVYLLGTVVGIQYTSKEII